MRFHLLPFKPLPGPDGPDDQAAQRGGAGAAGAAPDEAAIEQAAEQPRPHPGPAARRPAGGPAAGREQGGGAGCPACRHA